MLTGFNTNVTYKGEVFHIQTEDSGLKNPVITTILYIGGVILASQKTSYKEFLGGGEVKIGDPSLKEKIRQLIRSQHKKMIEDLFSGRFDNIIEKVKGQSRYSDPSKEHSVRLTVQTGDTFSVTSPPTHGSEVKFHEGLDNNLKKEAEPSDEGFRKVADFSEQRDNHSPDKKRGVRSLDDILLEHIMKKTKELK